MNIVFFPFSEYKIMQYMLAPIEDMTSNAFRTICYNHGADLTFTEQTKVEALSRNNKSTWQRIIQNDDTPTVIQLTGAKEYNFKKFLSKFQPKKGFKGFNLNYGCPSQDIIRIGMGAALIRRITKTKNLIKIFKDYNYPISIKMRLGLNKFDKEKKIYLNLINEVDADFFIVHARTADQSYYEKADYSIYEEITKTGKAIVANGDIDSREKVNFLESMGIKGVMIGRAAIKNPAIFNELKEIADKFEIKEFTELSERYNEPYKYRKNIIKHMG